MKWKFAICWPAVSLLGLLGSGCARESAPRPNQAPWFVSPSYVDLGNVSPGKDAHTVVQLTNHSGHRASVPRFYLSCDCVAVETEVKEVDEGQSTRLAIYFDSSREGGASGEFVYMLEADNGQGGRILLAKIRARVLGPGSNTSPPS